MAGIVLGTLPPPILVRLSPNMPCRRSIYKNNIELDYICSSSFLRFVGSWCDFALSTGLDHRCVHCLVDIPAAVVAKTRRPTRLKNWKPMLDGDQKPSTYHSFLCRGVDNREINSVEQLESLLHRAGRKCGQARRKQPRFKPSAFLQHLRQQRRT